LSLLLVLLVPLAVLFTVIAVAANKKDEKGGEEMFKQLYVHLVLFATLMMTIGGGISIFMSAADIISPSSSYYERYEDYKTNAIEEAKVSKEKINEQQIRDEYERMLSDDKKQTEAEAKNTIIKSFGFIIIPFPVFLYFNRMRKNNKESQE